MKESRVYNAQDMRGVLVPVGKHHLLLPNAAVAEVLGFEEPAPENDAPDWLLGRIDWRGWRIPVISWERALEGCDPDWHDSYASGRTHWLKTQKRNPRP